MRGYRPKKRNGTRRSAGCARRSMRFLDYRDDITNRVVLPYPWIIERALQSATDIEG